MNKPSKFIWLAIVLLLFLPSAAGRFLLDIAGGIMMLFLLTPILIAGAGWIGWKLIQPKLTKCEQCGTTFFNKITTCPICGSSISNNESSIAASSVVIDITAESTNERQNKIP